jgi:hypothetical protein
MFLDKRQLYSNEPDHTGTTSFSTIAFGIKTQHKDTQHKDTQHKDTQHKDTQHKDTQHKDTQQP